MPQPADMLNLGFLSEYEQQLIMGVLQRDEALRRIEEKRVRKLKTELLDVKRKGAKRGSGKYSQQSCGRCQEPLSRLSLFSSQCKICNHHVCQKCRTVVSEGTWLCNVCAKESAVRKMTGDWFYNQSFNRFSTAPGHGLVSHSLKRRSQCATSKEEVGVGANQESKKHEAAEELPLKSSGVNPAPPAPLPQAKPRSLISNRTNSSENSGSVASRESIESKDGASLRPARSDTESAENFSINGHRAETESGRGTPEELRTKSLSAQSSSAGSSTSSVAVPLKSNVLPESQEKPAPAVVQVSASPDLEVERLFKKSIKRHSRPNEFVSTMDLHNEPGAPDPSMGSRSRSVPGLDIKEVGEEEEEEDEDIDNLVNFHKKAMVTSSSSLSSSKSTLGSLMSIYSESGDFDSVEVSGDIVFSLTYNKETQSLQLFIKECQGLAYGDTSRHFSSPYIKCYLLPDKSRQSKRKTSTKRNTINPVYNETLKYSVSYSQLMTRSLLISVWHHGRLKRNTFLGEVEIPLDSRNLDSLLIERMALMSKASVSSTSTFSQYKGELVISLKYVTPQKTTAEKTKAKKSVPVDGGELHVLIKEANNLIAMKAAGLSDTFVKSYLHPSKSKSMKRKTPVVKKSLDPNYNHTFVYGGLTLEQLRGMCLELTVWDREAMLSNEFLGGVRLSSGKGNVLIGKEEVQMDSVGEEVNLWHKMMQYPDSWAEGTLPLRSTMEKTKGK
ncbi:synaptotagmin-like protein 4 isoform X1 [Nelusetta ayraudi]|uniref:synaptotagmin-like protein 4 isoform X1 n=1 Tax=Nelusetta ayraudi TaxID=303726 RepID=UPI003F6EFD50